MEPNSNGIVRFGVFEADVEARELRKHGLRVKLQDQPFQVLALLLERPGEVVTREDLQQALWPADTFVEFDHGLNTAIQKIRAAIGDSPSNPRFIETIPRRGYRFIGPVDSGVPSAPEVRAEPSIKTIWTERGRLIAVLAAAAAAIALVAAVAFRSPSAASYPVPVLTQITFDTGLSFMPAISPDGKFVVFASDRSGEKNFDIWLRQVGVEKALRLTEHEADDLRPVFSPDGGTIAFSSTRDGGGLYTVPVLGGASRLVAPVRASRHAFSPDGRWLAYTTENRPWAELVLVPASGGEPQQLEAPPGGVIGQFAWLPGNRILFGNFSSGFHVGSPQDGSMRSVDLGPDSGSVGLPGVAALLHWHQEKRGLVFRSQGPATPSVWLLPFNAETLRPTGVPEQLVATTGDPGDPSFSLDGKSVFADLESSDHLWRIPLDVHTGTTRGSVEPLTDEAASISRPFLSRDGKKIAYFSNRTGNDDIWTFDMSTRAATRVTTSPDLDRSPVISPNGKDLLYSVLKENRRFIALAPTQGGPAIFIPDDGDPTDWSPDGRWVTAHHRAGGIRVIDPKLRVPGVPILDHPKHRTYDSQFSPDGKWLAFHARISQDRRQIFVAPFKEKQTVPPEEWIAITDGELNDRLPVWSPGGSLIYFISERDGYPCIYAQPLDPEQKRPTGEVRSVYHLHDARLSLPTNTGRVLVAEDYLFLNVRESRGNIWMQGPQDNR